LVSSNQNFHSPITYKILLNFYAIPARTVVLRPCESIPMLSHSLPDLLIRVPLRLSNLTSFSQIKQIRQLTSCLSLLFAEEVRFELTIHFHRFRFSRAVPSVTSIFLLKNLSTPTQPYGFRL
jgi:hypothetical protein